MWLISKKAKSIQVCRLNALIVLLFISISVIAQKQDYVWIQGYESVDWAINTHYGNTIMDFNYTPKQIRKDSLGMNFDRANTSYCDSNGSLMFYTNGIYVANALDEKIQNSDSLNAGEFQYSWDPSIQYDGYRLPQSVLALPAPAQLNKYYLIHTWADTINSGADFAIKRLYSTFLDMDANNSHGRVEYKNKTEIQWNLAYELAAVQHANGRDWWVLVQQRNSNCYYRVLIDPSGIHVMPDLTCGGPNIIFGDINTICFSPDGSKFASLDGYQGLTIYDFDRCDGKLSDPRYMHLPILVDSNWQGIGVSISPNSRFLYVGVMKQVYQFDLWASDILASIDTVARYDGSMHPFGSFFNTMQLGPDGEIYEGCGNGEYVYHVIEQPDKKGDSCMFIQHGITLPTYSPGVPNYPNYRLGPLLSSGCDTLTGINDNLHAGKEKLLKVYPNPATDFVVVDYGFTDWNKGEVSLEIGNELGQVVYNEKIPMYSGFQKIDISRFASGIYNTFIKRNGNIVAVAKFAKQ